MSARGLLLAAAVLAAAGVRAEPVPPGSATTGKAKRASGTGVVNLNTATIDQLDALPGVSSRLAAAVVAERTARPFTRPEDLMRVHGVTRRRFERLRPHLGVTGPTSFVPPPGSRPSGGAKAARTRASRP